MKRGHQLGLAGYLGGGRARRLRLTVGPGSSVDSERPANVHARASARAAESRLRVRVKFISGCVRIKC